MKLRDVNFLRSGANRKHTYIGCSFCGLIRRPEHLIDRHWYLPANWRSFIQWSPDHWVSQCYASECDRRFYFTLFCVFITRVSQCPISLPAEHPIYIFCHMTTDVFWIGDSIYCILWYSVWLRFTAHYYTHYCPVTFFLPLLGSGFQRLTFPFLWAPELSPASAARF
jgi:hypothetical protein